MAYLLDTNVFIQSWNFDYQRDFCPEFWNWLVQMNRENKIYSINEVLNEIRRKDDELAGRVERLDDDFFIEIDSNVEKSPKASTVG